MLCSSRIWGEDSQFLLIDIFSNGLKPTHHWILGYLAEHIHNQYNMLSETQERDFWVIDTTSQSPQIHGTGIYLPIWMLCVMEKMIGMFSLVDYILTYFCLHVFVLIMDLFFWFSIIIDPRVFELAPMFVVICDGDRPLNGVLRYTRCC